MRPAARCARGSGSDYGPSVQGCWALGWVVGGCRPARRRRAVAADRCRHLRPAARCARGSGPGDEPSVRGLAMSRRCGALGRADGAGEARNRERSERPALQFARGPTQRPRAFQIELRAPRNQSWVSLDYWPCTQMSFEHRSHPSSLSALTEPGYTEIPEDLSIGKPIHMECRVSRVIRHVSPLKNSSSPALPSFSVRHAVLPCDRRFSGPSRRVSGYYTH